MSETFDDLSRSRRLFPVGDRVRGIVSAIPMGPGRAGVLVELGQPSEGWVDMLHLPIDPSQGPAVGRSGLVEDLQLRPGQVRLCPLVAGMRGPRTLYSRCSG